MSEDYFSLLGIKKDFDIDTRQLTENHLKLQRALHPDRYVNDTPRQKLEAINRISMVNDAFQLLHDPYQRGVYLLQLSGWHKPQENITVKSPILLMEQIELRENLADIRFSDEPFEMLESFQKKVIYLLEEQQQKISALFKKVTLESNEKSFDSSVDNIFENLIRLKFLNKLDEEISRVEEQLDE